MSRRTNGRHRRRGALRRAAPAVATAAGSVAFVTTIGTAAFWLIPGDQRPGSGSSDAAPPPAGLIDPTGSTSPAVPGTSPSSDSTSAPDSGAGSQTEASSTRGQPRASAGERSGGGSRSVPNSPRPRSSSSRTPRPASTTSEPDQPTLPLPTPSLPPTPLIVTTPPLPPLLSLSVSVSVTDLLP